MAAVALGDRPPHCSHIFFFLGNSFWLQLGCQFFFFFFFAVAAILPASNRRGGFSRHPAGVRQSGLLARRLSKSCFFTKKVQNNIGFPCLKMILAPKMLKFSWFYKVLQKQNVCGCSGVGRPTTALQPHNFFFCELFLAAVRLLFDPLFFFFFFLRAVAASSSTSSSRGGFSRAPCWSASCWLAGRDGSQKVVFSPKKFKITLVFLVLK